eukprot:TRINITY_DN20220_c0_g1_i1.p1 TRINITY_DN20220_c0_g1~~TRINITY_DN20220_c0_g1_i1.p1  ORF type:complete len:400 (+),score=79.57 TRINITY_DN20220_c0_g1_i1:50-1201(+)
MGNWCGTCEPDAAGVGDAGVQAVQRAPERAAESAARASPTPPRSSGPRSAPRQEPRRPGCEHAGCAAPRPGQPDAASPVEQRAAVRRAGCAGGAEVSVREAAVEPAHRRRERAAGRRGAVRVRIGRSLGQGTFACVDQGEYRLPGGEWAPCAVKQGEARELRREADMLQRADGLPGVVRSFGLAHAVAGEVLLLELCELGSLRQQMDHGSFHVDALGPLAVQLCGAVEGLHARSILHRDIKPANVVLAHVPQGVVCKLCDFGLSAVLAAGGRLRAPVGTKLYAAPEVLGARVYNTAADVFSLACVLFELVATKAPKHKARGVLRMTSLDELPCGPNFRPLLQPALDTDPGGRPTAAQMLGWCRGALGETDLLTLDDLPSHRKS